jgi:hypothetical protein
MRKQSDGSQACRGRDACAFRHRRCCSAADDHLRLRRVNRPPDGQTLLILAYSKAAESCPPPRVIRREQEAMLRDE